MTRALASIKAIDSLTSIEGADRIECAHIGGWTVVVKKGEFEAGGLCIYFEIDSWVPHDVAPFLSSGSVDEGGYKLKYLNDVAGNRLRTKRLKGTLSQGLCLPLHSLTEEQVDFCQEYDSNDPTGCDLTELLGVQLYEKPIPAQLRGTMRGNFPPFIPKTDQERVQNLQHFLTEEASRLDMWEVTEKLDGSSMTVYNYEGYRGVCSRNIDLKQTDDNAFWATAIREELILKVMDGFALQGELCGPGIQGNQYGLTEPTFFLFDIFDIKKQKYLDAFERNRIARSLDIKEVPFLQYTQMINDIPMLLKEAEGKSFLNDSVREGIVFKSTVHTSRHFKAINNDWLLKYE